MFEDLIFDRKDKQSKKSKSPEVPCTEDTDCGLMTPPAGWGGSGNGSASPNTPAKQKPPVNIPPNRKIKPKQSTCEEYAFVREFKTEEDVFNFIEAILNGWTVEKNKGKISLKKNVRYR